MTRTDLLVANGFAPSLPISQPGDAKASDAGIGTVLSNLAQHGFVPSASLFAAMRELSDDGLASFWAEAKSSIKKVSGASRKMGKYVVYKNFPQEVLDKTESEYWIAQILMYWGLPNKFFTTTKEKRKPLKDHLDLKILNMSGAETLSSIWNRLVAAKARWNDNQSAHAKFLLADGGYPSLDVDVFSFKENGIILAAIAMANGQPVFMENATDVLRLAAVLSSGDVSLREKPRFIKFSRPVRRQLLDLLLSAKNLEDDFALRPEMWKRLLHVLHPGDWKAYAKVSAAYDSVYCARLKTHATAVERGILERDPAVLSVMKARPGDFLRRFHKAYATFGPAAAEALVDVLPLLTTSQLLKFDGYLSTINKRRTLMVAPRGNWAKAQVLPNKKVKISLAAQDVIQTAISTVIAARLAEVHPEGFAIDKKVEGVKLQTSDQKLAAYGRGTTFPIPENMKFVRSASYWESKSEYGNIWYDVGWNFYGPNWVPVGTCAWNRVHDIAGAVFSGDPTNSKDLKGRACQMIDLDLATLKASGIRYAVWSVLCYSRQPFSSAEDVLATLQWGETAQEGKLFEPARAQMVFPLLGDALTKYVAYLDLHENTLVYVDADLRGRVSSADENLATIGDVFPAYLEYLGSLPSVADIFRHAPAGSTPVLYTDADEEITSGPAYVFRPTNANNTFDQMELNSLLGG